MNISVIRTRQLLDYLFIRKLRNENRHLMTGDNRELSLWDQIKFWYSHPYHLSLYIARLDGERVGYMVLKDDFDTTYITEVVSDSARRQGIGKALIRYAQTFRNHLTADIFKTNLPSIELHLGLGFRRKKAGAVSRYVWD